MTIVWVALFILAVLLSWLLNLVGLPGNWLIVASAVIYAWLMPSDGRAAIGWPVVATVAGLAVVGELLELVAGAAGVKRAGGSRRAAVLALAGSLAGGMTGVVVGVPVPLVGPIVAAVLFAAGGAFLGAVVGEQWAGRSEAASYETGLAAFWGRLWGTLAKVLVGAVLVAVVLAALLV